MSVATGFEGSSKKDSGESSVGNHGPLVSGRTKTSWDWRTQGNYYPSPLPAVVVAVAVVVVVALADAAAVGACQSRFD